MVSLVKLEASVSKYKWKSLKLEEKSNVAIIEGDAEFIIAYSGA